MSRTRILFIIWLVISAILMLIIGVSLDDIMNSGVVTPDEEVLEYSLYMLFVPPVLLAVPFVAIDWILKPIDWILNVARRPTGLTDSSNNADISLEELTRAQDCLIGLSENLKGAKYGHLRVYNNGVSYICRKCSTSTTFDVEVKTSQTALAEKFNRAMGTLDPYEHDYCDFDCSGCGVSVRCIYAINEVSNNHYEYYPETVYVEKKAYADRYIDAVTPTPSAKDRADPFRNSVVQRAETSKLKSVIKVGTGVFIAIVTGLYLAYQFGMIS